MKTKTPIQFYLKNRKFNATSNKDTKFYLDRLHYYQHLLNLHPPVKKATGYGEIRFEIDREGIQNMFDFWFNAMIWFIETKGIREYKKQKEKK